MSLAQLQDQGKRINEALDTIAQYGQIDGADHKAWVIDQVVHILTGDYDTYHAWVRDYCYGEDGSDTYTWDVGIAP
jgi:hypothetical protein